MTREEFKKLAMSRSHGYSEEDVNDVFSSLSDEEALPGISWKKLSLEMEGVSTEEEWLDLQAGNLPWVTILEIPVQSPGKSV